MLINGSAVNASVVNGNSTAVYSVSLTPTTGTILVEGYIYSRTYTGNPSAGTILVQGQVPTLSIKYGFSTHSDIYELHGAVQWGLDGLIGKDITINTQMLYDNDNGTDGKDICIAAWGDGKHTPSTKAASGFINTDNYGAPAFVDGYLAGIASAIHEESTRGISQFGGAYGAVGFDMFISEYLDFIESVVGESVPNRVVKTNQITVARTTPSQETSVVHAYPSLIGDSVFFYLTSNNSIYLSADDGKTWRKESFSRGFNHASAVYWWLSGSCTVDGKCFMAFNNTIKYTTDGGLTWTTVFTATSSICDHFVSNNYQWSIDSGNMSAKYDIEVGPWYSGAIKVHPITGVLVCTGDYGYVYYSSDSGTTWTENHIGTYGLNLIFHKPSNTFIAYSGNGAWASTDGLTWSKKTSTAISYDLLLIDQLLVEDRRTITSINSGVTWSDVWASINTFSPSYSYIGFYHGNRVYFCCAKSSFSDSEGVALLRSTDLKTWQKVTSLVDHVGVLGFYPDRYAFNGQTHVFMDSTWGELFVSQDNGVTFSHYTHLVSENPYNGLFYSTTLDLWVAYGANGNLFVTKDPSGEWNKLAFMQYNGATDGTVKSCCEVNGTLILGTSGDIHTLSDPSYAGSTYVPNYPIKPEPITASGLIGFFCSAGQASGTVLQDGLHILTVAHAVYGVTSGDYSSFNFVFNVPDGVTIEQPTVTGITIHPSYSHTASTSGWFNYDIAVITLAEPIDSRVSRYELFTGMEGLPQVYTKVAYGHYYDPVNGTHDAYYHFIAFKNRYEAYGQDLVSFGYSYAMDGMHLLYDYDNGLTAQDAIGQGFINQTTNLGDALEGFTAPGRSGSAGLLNGKIAGITWGNVSIDPYDINPADQGTYGEVGIDVRISAFADWIAVTSDFGLDFSAALPGFSGSELEFAEPKGLAIDGLLSYPTGTLLAAEPEQFNLEDYLPGLDNDFAMVSPWQAEGELPLMLCDMQLKPAETFALEKSLAGLSIDFSTVANGDVALQGRFPSLLSDIMLEASNRFEWSTMLSLDSDIAMGLAGEFALSHRLPSLTAELSIASDLSISGYLPGITGDLSAYAASISIQAKLPGLDSELGIVSYTVVVEGSLPGITCEMPIDSLTCEFSGAFNGLMGSMSLAQAKLFSIDYTLPSLLPESVIESINIEDMASETILPGLHGFINARFSNPSCSTRYL